MSKTSDYYQKILERIRLAVRLENNLSSDQLGKTLRGIEEMVGEALKKTESDLIQVSGERDAAIGQVNDLQHELRQVSGERDTAISQVNNLQHELEQVSGDRDAARSQVSDLQKGLKQAEKKPRNWWLWLAGVAGFIIGLGLMFSLYPRKVSPAPVFTEKGPTIVIYTPDLNTNVSPDQTVAIISELTGIEPKVTWTATCIKNKDCKVLTNPTGTDIFFVAPNTPGEIVTVRATVKDKYGQEDHTSLLFKVGIGK